jgi:carboxypeptidase C (cathepsin A)
MGVSRTATCFIEMRVMPNRRLALTFFVVAFLVQLTVPEVARAAAAGSEEPQVALPDAVVVPRGTALMPSAERQHSGRFNGKALRYRSVVEEVPIRDPDGGIIASVVSVSYLAKGTGEARPVIFAFNGGPGSASIWLHMGLLGPRRPDYGTEAGEEEIRPRTVAPFGLVDNHESPLDVADVVLIDPPGTGYSRVFGEENVGKVFGIQQDAEVTVQFIREWLRRYDRGNSPKYLLGESYGTVRAALVAKRLAGGPTATGRMDGITLNGVILMGQAMDDSRRVAELASVTLLPSAAATAWFHGKASHETSLESHVQRARVFANGRYLQALFAGSRLPDEARVDIAQELSGYTGIPASRLLELDLRLEPSTFSREVLRAEGQQVGIYDARFVLPLASSGNDPVADDPAMGQYVPLYVATASTHFRDALGVDTERAYNAIEFRRINQLFWKGLPPAPDNHALALATAMRRNPRLRVLVVTGWYDLATPVGAAEQAVALSGMDISRVDFREYESGHMPYIGAKSRQQLSSDMRAFVTRNSD